MKNAIYYDFFLGLIFWVAIFGGKITVAMIILVWALKTQLKSWPAPLVNVLVKLISQNHVFEI